MSWNFYIEEFEANVIDVNNLKITEGKESKFRSRSELDGKIVLVEEGYDYLKLLESTRKYDKFPFMATEGGVIRFTGEFTIFDIKFDDDKKTATFTPSLRDKYTELSEKSGIENNAISNLNRNYVDIENYTYIYYYSGFWSYPSPETWPTDFTKVWHDTKHQSETFCYMVFAQERIIASNTSGLSDYGFAIVDKIEDNISLWARIPVNFTIPADNEIITLAHVRDITYNINIPGFVYGNRRTDIYDTGLPDSVPDEVIIGTIADNDGWANLGIKSLTLNELVSPSKWEENTYFDILAIDKTVYTSRNIFTFKYPVYKLQEVLNNLLAQSNPDFSGSIKSTLLFRDAPESGVENTFGQRIYKDYVTGKLINAKYLITNRDFKNPFASNLSTIEDAKLFDLIDDLCSIYNSDWYIDSDGNLRIEHISYKSKINGIDISNKKTLVNAYQYDNKLPNRVIFEPREARSDDFTEKDILYGNAPAINGEQESVENISMKVLITDVDGVNEFLSSLTNEGFILIETDSYLDVSKGVGAYSDETDLQNVNLSPANSLYNYYRHEMYKPTSEINEKEAEALTLKKLKFQDKVNFKNSIKPDIEKSITTNLGVGEIESIEYACNDQGSYTLKVIYDD